MTKLVKYPGLAGAIARSGESQKSVALAIGITPMTMSNKMTGKKDFTLGEVEKICDYLKKDYYELFK